MSSNREFRGELPPYNGVKCKNLILHMFDVIPAHVADYVCENVIINVCSDVYNIWRNKYMNTVLFKWCDNVYVPKMIAPNLTRFSAEASTLFNVENLALSKVKTVDIIMSSYINARYDESKSDDMPFVISDTSLDEQTSYSASTIVLRRCKNIGVIFANKNLQRVVIEDCETFDIGKCELAKKLTSIEIISSPFTNNTKKHFAKVKIKNIDNNHVFNANTFVAEDCTTVAQNCRTLVLRCSVIYLINFAEIKDKYCAFFCSDVFKN